MERRISWPFSTARRRILSPPNRTRDKEIHHPGTNQNQHAHCLSPLFHQHADKCSGIGPAAAMRASPDSPMSGRADEFLVESAKNVNGRDCHPVENEPRADDRIRQIVECGLHASGVLLSRRLDDGDFGSPAEFAPFVALEALGSQNENSSTSRIVQTACSRIALAGVRRR